MDPASDFALLLFSTDLTLIRRAVTAGVRGVIVDWERTGKAARQAAYDTQINQDTVADLRRVRACADGLVVCRINGYGVTTRAEVELAIAAGADEILLPMVRGPGEVLAVLEMAAGRCGVGILVETVAATRAIGELASLPLSRVYVGLNDLCIERRSASIFTAVVDGTVERVRRACRVPFGFAGLTLPELGHPVPCRLLIAEMARLGTDFSFLRRSFHHDLRGRDPTVEIPRLLDALRQAGRRSATEVERDRRELAAVLASATWPAGEPIREAVMSADGWVAG